MSAKSEISAAKPKPSSDARLYLIRVCKEYKAETAISILYPVPRDEVERILRQTVHQLGAHEFFENLEYAVVIHGENVTKHSPEMFKWICGMGPNPMDSNWMGQGGIQPEHLYKKWPIGNLVPPLSTHVISFRSKDAMWHIYDHGEVLPAIGRH